MLKRDKKSVRICGDFRITVNPVSKLDRYPIPKIEDLFARLQKGRYFTKLDLSQAYQQLPLDDDSKKFVVVNTHRGLFTFQVHSLTIWNRVGARDFPTSHRKRSAGYRRGGGIPRRHTHLREYGGESSGHTRRSAKQTRQGRIEGEEVQM